MPKIDHQQLLSFCKQLLFSGGMAKDDADLVADLLVKGELRGYAGHGVIRVNPYLNWIKDGTYQINDKPAIERDGKITAVVDGKHYIGQVAAHFAMALAIKKGKPHTVDAATARGKNPKNAPKKATSSPPTDADK